MVLLLNYHFFELRATEIESKLDKDSHEILWRDHIPKGKPIFELSEFLKSKDLISDFPENVILEFYAKRFDIYLNNSFIFYPGTFNPVHEGHLECIRQGSKVRDVMILPDRNPKKDPLAPEQGISALEEFLKILNSFGPSLKEGIEISPIFLLNHFSNPTSSWLKNVKGIKILLMGEDSFVSLKSWINYEELISSLNEILVLPRSGNKDDFKKILDEISGVNSSLKITLLENHEFEHLSSSMMRGKK